MKVKILTVAAAVAAILIGNVTQAKAGGHFSIRFGGLGHGGHSYQPYDQGYGYGHDDDDDYQSYQGYHQGHGHCEQPYLVETVEVNRCTQCQTAYDNYGRPYTYHVTVVTYCDHYSNGATRTWSQTYS